MHSATLILFTFRVSLSRWAVNEGAPSRKSARLIPRKYLVTGAIFFVFLGIDYPYTNISI